MYQASVIIIATVLSFECQGVELYRYQDSSGQWIFGDKKSLYKNTPDQQAIEKVTFSDNRKQHAKPSLQIINDQADAKNKRWLLRNPLPVMVQHWLAIKGKKRFLKSVLAKPFEKLELTLADLKLTNKKIALNLELEHHYLLGKPIKPPGDIIIPLPFANNKRFLISQGFDGKFSHTGRGNRFAVDIAMPIGESIQAVKPGLVADGRDDFSIGGAANYFLDKANHVTIMHDDGSYGIYAHILYGSMAVAIGERVIAGQVLARIGNTGYSTGPHLHFVLRYNSGKGAYSIPYKFQTKKGLQVPKQGRYYSGTLSPLKH